MINNNVESHTTTDIHFESLLPTRSRVRQGVEVHVIFHCADPQFATPPFNKATCFSDLQQQKYSSALCLYLFRLGFRGKNTWSGWRLFGLPRNNNNASAFHLKYFATLPSFCFPLGNRGMGNHASDPTLLETSCTPRRAIADHVLPKCLCVLAIGALDLGLDLLLNSPHPRVVNAPAVGSWLSMGGHT